MKKKCLFNNCGRDDYKDVSTHIQHHLMHDNKIKEDMVCLWEGCRYKKKLTTLNNFVQHIKNHFLEKENVCKFCYSLFSKEESLKRHEERHEIENDKMARYADGLFKFTEQRDEEMDVMMMLLNDRAYYVNYLRVLKDEVTRDKKDDDTWKDYL